MLVNLGGWSLMTTHGIYSLIGVCDPFDLELVSCQDPVQNRLKSPGHGNCGVRRKLVGRATPLKALFPSLGHSP